MELLQGAAFPPSLLTQRFTTRGGPRTRAAPTVNTFQHLAHWTHNTLALYQSREIPSDGSRATGLVSNGRIPGKINLNTIWDLEVLRALCDAQAGNSFYYDAKGNAVQDTNVDAIYTALTGQRTPSLTAALPQVNALSDRP